MLFYSGLSCVQLWDHRKEKTKYEYWIWIGMRVVWGFDYEACIIRMGRVEKVFAQDRS